MDITITAPQGGGKTRLAEAILGASKLSGLTDTIDFEQVMVFTSLCNDYGDPLGVDGIIERLVKYNPPAVIFDECMASMYNFVAAVTAVKKFRFMRPKFERAPYTKGVTATRPFIAIYCRQGDGVL